MSTLQAKARPGGRTPPRTALGAALTALLFACSLASCAARDNPRPAHPEPPGKAEAAGVRKDATSGARTPEQSGEKADAGVKPAGRRVFRGSYANRQYGYSVTIPEGLVGTGAADPAPDHGVGITLSERPKAHIWTSAYYTGDPEASVDKEVDNFIEHTRKNDASWLEVLSREPARLGDLPAVRAVLRYQARDTGEVMINDTVTALRGEDETGVPDGITYAVGLSTPEARYPQDKAVYERVVGSWRARRVTE